MGKGPWQNAKSVVVANSVEDLNSESNNITKQTALNEKGETITFGLGGKQHLLNPCALVCLDQCRKPGHPFG